MRIIKGFVKGWYYILGIVQRSMWIMSKLFKVNL